MERGILLPYFVLLLAINSLFAQTNQGFKVGDFVLEKSSNSIFKVYAINDGKIKGACINFDTYEEVVKITDNANGDWIRYLPKKNDMLIKNDQKTYKVVDDVVAAHGFFQVQHNHLGDRIIETVPLDFLTKMNALKKATETTIDEARESVTASIKNEVIDINNGFCFFSMNDLLGSWQMESNFYYELRDILNNRNRKDEFKLWLKTFKREDSTKSGSIEFVIDEETKSLRFNFRERAMSPQYERNRLRGIANITADRIISVELSKNSIADKIAFQIEVIGFSFLKDRRVITVRVYDIK